MTAKKTLHPDRLFPLDPETRDVARRLYAEVANLPIVSPHGHTDPRWYAEDAHFKNPAELFLIPDHYVFRMLHSQGVPLESMGVPRVDGGPTATDPEAIWDIFAKNYHLYRCTPSRMWFEHVMAEVFDIHERLCPENARALYERVDAALAKPEFSVRALYDRFNIEAVSTTDSPLDDLAPHRVVRESGWSGRVIPAFRPDPVVDPEFEGFIQGVEKLGEMTGENTATWGGYLKALAARREYFISMGATSTDHGHPSAATANLGRAACEALFATALAGKATPEEAELFRAQMLTEMVRMSLDDGLVIQIHPGSFRNHSAFLYGRFGRDKGADIPARTEYVHALKPMLDLFGHEKNLSVILFTLDESSYSRELAPLAGVYPLLKLGPAWWFHDSPEGMMRYRRMTTETAGFYNTVGFNDDTRAFLSIPARHDVARRVDCAFLAEMARTGRIDEDEAVETARDLAYNLVKKAYKL